MLEVWFWVSGLLKHLPWPTESRRMPLPGQGSPPDGVYLFGTPFRRCLFVMTVIGLPRKH